MYRIYAHQREKGWVIVDVKLSKEDAIEVADNLEPKNYYSYLVVEADENGEKVVQRKDLTKECEVEFVDNLKTDYEVKATTFKPSRMKKKEELRKLTQNYTSTKDFEEDDYLNF